MASYKENILTELIQNFGITSPQEKELVRKTVDEVWWRVIELCAHEAQVVPKKPEKEWQWDYLEFIEVDKSSITRLKGL